MRVIPLILLAITPLANAGSFEDYAEVLNVLPLRETYQVPVDRCWTETITRRDNSVGGTVLGGITGGVLGHQIGKGNGRDAATIVGALAGAVVGNNLSEPRHRLETVQRCATEYEQRERIRTYRVTYQYQGHVFTEEMESAPGRRLPVYVSLHP